MTSWCDRKWSFFSNCPFGPSGCHVLVTRLSSSVSDTGTLSPTMLPIVPALRRISRSASATLGLKSAILASCSFFCASSASASSFAFFFVVMTFWIAFTSCCIWFSWNSRVTQVLYSDSTSSTSSTDAKRLRCDSRTTSGLPPFSTCNSCRSIMLVHQTALNVHRRVARPQVTSSRDHGHGAVGGTNAQRCFFRPLPWPL